MYRSPHPEQLSFKDFYLPFGGKLSGNNRWVKLAELVPWSEFETEYAEQFSAKQGAPAKSFRIALGALIIKEKLGTSDEETVEQIRENPYLQYFLGFSEYQDSPPFEASMFVHFRKRLSFDVIGKINESVVQSCLRPPEPEPSQTQDTSSPLDSSHVPKGSDDDDDGPPPPNQGQLILDATCAPMDIRYPTDLGLLNQARQASEQILDRLYEQLRSQFQTKPRTYRRQARTAYLAVAKQRKPSRKKIRKGIRQQLGYLRRNLAHIDTLIAAGTSLSRLSQRQYRILLVIHEVVRQQQQMYDTQIRRIDDRIVSLTQPHVRPIVRGKAGVPVEFGPKLSVSCVNGCVSIDRLSWNNFNESGDLITQVEAFRRRFGHYPESVHADQIYRTRANRQWCKAQGIRMSGPPLGRPTRDATLSAQLKRQARQDAKVRVQIEGKFGQAKRRFSLARVMEKLAVTAASAIAITFLVMNLEQRLRRLLMLLFGQLFRPWTGLLKTLATGYLSCFNEQRGYLEWGRYMAVSLRSSSPAF